MNEAAARGTKGSSYERGGHILFAKSRNDRHMQRGSMTKAKASKRPTNCGTYMYWKDGKCQDARLKK
jgi:hypothetical protein